MEAEKRTVGTVLPNLGQYYGTTTYMRHKILPTQSRGLLLTDGLQYVVEKAGAYWLTDIILIRGKEWLSQADGFCVVKLEVKDNAATIKVTDGNYKPVYQEEVDFTDFPEPGLEFFLTLTETDMGEEMVLMLKSEY